MPRPNHDIDVFGKLNFVTNYFLAGCEADPWLFVEFAREPAKEVLMLFLIPDFQDIGQAIFDPRGGRKRKPGRHGRKRRTVPGFPDPSDVIGQRARAHLNPHNALKFGPVSYAFRIWNIYEGIGFMCAIVEGMTDVGYEGLLGVLSVDANSCIDFPRMSRDDYIPELVGGAGPQIDPIGLGNLITAEDFNHSYLGCMAASGPFSAHFACTLTNDQFEPYVQCSVGIGNWSTGEVYESQIAKIGLGETVSLSAGGSFSEGTWVSWGLRQRDGFVTATSRSATAFGHSQFPWPI